ncbi:MAG: gliding motility-associated C-terminal domain-containing protein [Bacteroidia bacterium]
MKQLAIIFSFVALLTSCSKDEFEPKPLLNNFQDTTYSIDISNNQIYYDFCLYPYNSLTLDATANDTSATYLWEPGGETTSSIQVDHDDYYTLNYYSNSTGPIQISIAIYNCIPAMYATNSFTPNSDGLNDSWRPIYSSISSIHWEIRDNEGVKVFSTDDLTSSGWDGEYQNVPMPSGFYLYYINYSTLTTENNILTGSLELIR